MEKLLAPPADLNGESSSSHLWTAFFLNQAGKLIIGCSGAKGREMFIVTCFIPVLYAVLELLYDNTKYHLLPHKILYYKQIYKL